MARFFRATWPVFAWMVVVFCMSTEVGSPAHSSRILFPVLRWLDPSISAAGLERAQLVARKAAHLTEYAVLGLLLLHALRATREPPIRGWSWPLAGWALAIAAAYATTDEIHQIFVPTRGPAVHDVVIDTCGAAVGLAIALWWIRRRQPAPAVVS